MSEHTVNIGLHVIKMGIHILTIRVHENGTGSLISNLKDDVVSDDYEKDRNRRDFNTAVDGMESLVLACACAGLNIDSPKFKQALEVAYEAIGNNYG